MFKRIGAGLASAARRVARVMPALLRDLAGLAGVALIAFGAWQIYPPAGFIVAGVLLVVGAIILGMQRGG
jgi:hypothetical protein